MKCKVHCWKEICHEGNSDAEKGNRSHILHFCKLNVMEVIDKIRKVLRFLVDCLSPWKNRIVSYNNK